MRTTFIRKLRWTTSCAGFLAVALAMPTPSLAIDLPRPPSPFPIPIDCVACILIPRTLASSVSPTAIVVKDGQVYFMDASAPVWSWPSLKRVSTSGGTVSLLFSLTGAYTPVSMVADASYLYWVVPQSPSISSRARVFARGFASGITSEIFAVEDYAALDTQALSTIAGTSPRLLYANSWSGRLYQISMGLSSWTNVALTPERDPVTHVSYYPKSVVNEGGMAYFAKDTGGLFSIPVGGGTVSSVPVTVGRNTRLALDASYVYFTTNTAIRRYPRAGGVASDVVAVPEMPTAFILDGTNIYYILPTTATVWRTSLTSTATSRMWTADSTPQALAVDSTRLYMGSRTRLVSVAK